MYSIIHTEFIKRLHYLESVIQKFAQNYNESFVIPSSVTNATECRLMEFSEKKYYVALIRQIKNQYLIK